MTAEEFEDCCATLRERADQIVGCKRPDYTRENRDVLINFKAAAEKAGIRPLQAWLIHFEKQYSAIARYVKHPNAAISEPIRDRFADLRNYLYLGWGLINDKD